MGGVTVSGTQDGRNTSCLEPIGKVMLHQLIGGRNGDGTQLVQTQNSEPELIVPLQHQHDPVPPLDAQTLEVVGTLGRSILEVLKGEPAFGHVVCDVDHCQLVGVFPGQCVHRVKSKVVAIGVGVVQTGHCAVFVLGAPDKLIAQKPLLRCQILDDRSGFQLQCGIPLITGHDHGQEHAALTVNGDHAMGSGRIVEDRVAFVQYFLMVSNPDTHGTL